MFWLFCIMIILAVAFIPNIRTVFKYLFKNWTFSVDFLTEWVVHSCSNCLLILNLSSHSAPLLNGAGQVEQNEKRTWPALNLYYCNHLQKEIWNSIFSLLVIWNILACPNHLVVFLFQSNNFNQTANCCNLTTSQILGPKSILILHLLVISLWLDDQNLKRPQYT